jgi:phosphatidylserine/phosphatidylglycerophosphate/cardiolipin synthase-like enzyme
VVDSRAVVVSSQNFSPAGIRENRDAGVILESEDVAAYFEAIFLSDWTTKAKPFAPKVATPRASQGSKRSPKKVTKKSSRKNGR